MLSIMTLSMPPPTPANAWPHQPHTFPSVCGAGAVAWRTVQVLEGNWEFAYKADYPTNESVSLDGISFNRTQAVPAAWDAAWGTGLQYARGVGVYRTRVAVTPNRPLALHFGACSLFCRVYIDGVLVHNHTLGGFTPFWVPLEPSASSERELIVLTSNTFSKELTPTQYENYDFYQYGGLLRAVCLHELPATGPSIDRVEVKPLATPESGVPSGEVNITVVLHAAGDQPVDLEFGWDCPSAAPCSKGFSRTYHPVNGSIFIPAVPVPEARIWQPVAHPIVAPSLALHNITVRVASDALTVRFGLRTVSTSGRDILLNGKPMKLKGFNRHDMYPQLGPALPLSQYVADLDKLQLHLHGNFIRGAHYPQDSRFLDLCDERGVLVWNEARGLRLEHTHEGGGGGGVGCPVE